MKGVFVSITRGWCTCAILTALSTICIIIGSSMLVSMLTIAQATIEYDSQPRGETVLQLSAEKDLKAPVYLYYEVHGFYGNHKRYVRSISWDQIAGGSAPENPPASCQPRRYVDGKANASRLLSGAIFPCGLVPASLFNDTLQSMTSLCDQKPVQYSTKDTVVWTSLLKRLVGSTSPITNLNTVPNQQLGGKAEGLIRDNPALVNWAQLDAKPTVTKLLAVINEDIRAGCVLRVVVNNAYNTSMWSGAKRLILTGHTWAGSTRNLFLPVLFLVFGGLTELAALGFAAHAVCRTCKP